LTPTSAFGKGFFGLREFDMTADEIEKYSKENDLENKPLKKRREEKEKPLKKKREKEEKEEKPLKKKKVEKKEEKEENLMKSKFSIQDDGYLYLRYVLDINRRLKQEDRSVRI
jgi:hypothetical protein